MDEGQRKQRSTANALGGSTARACDSCLRRRARWYCGADNAFLCQACDASVHSANSLAGRHQRLRIHTASSSLAAPPPFSWRKRKARTPRAYQKQQATPAKSDPLVPDLEKEQEEELEMQLMCRVPVLDPDFADFCSTLEAKLPPAMLEIDQMLPYGQDALPGASTEMDVDCLLGVGLDEFHESALYMDGFSDVGPIKMDFDLDAIGDEMELYGKAQDGVASLTAAEEQMEGDGGAVLKKMGLRLDYDAVIHACSQSGCSPWVGGDRPRFYSDGCLPAAFMSMSEGGTRWRASGGEEREARVTRYKEKRRTRLFAKKIRYEVRKLNAEKRPRMKGRFVKRATLSDVSGPTFPYQY